MLNLRPTRLSDNGIFCNGEARDQNSPLRSVSRHHKDVMMLVDSSVRQSSNVGASVVLPVQWRLFGIGVYAHRPL